MTAASRSGGCPGAETKAAREAFERLASKWMMIVTYTLQGGPTRFNDLKNRLGVSAQALSRVLRDLERDGLIKRQVYPGVPARVEYSLTPLGSTICPIVLAIREWAETTAPAITAARSAYDRRRRVSAVDMRG